MPNKWVHSIIWHLKVLIYCDLVEKSRFPYYKHALNFTVGRFWLWRLCIVAICCHNFTLEAFIKYDITESNDIFFKLLIAFNQNTQCLELQKCVHTIFFECSCHKKMSFYIFRALKFFWCTLHFGTLSGHTMAKTEKFVPQKCGGIGSNGFHIKWIIGPHGNWKN